MLSAAVPGEVDDQMFRVKSERENFQDLARKQKQPKGCCGGDTKCTTGWRKNRNTSKQCKSDRVEMPLAGDTRQGFQRKLATHYHQAGWVKRLLGRVSNEMRVRPYVPRKKADRVGLTRSPQAEFFGFWSSRGPASPMIRAPTGAVRRMASTAMVSTSMPYFFSVSSSRVTAMSRAVEPIAACRTKEELRWCISSPGG